MPWTISTEAVMLVKAALAVAAAACAVFLYLAHRNGLDRVRRVTIAVLAPTAILAVFAYAHLGDSPPGTKFLNTYDVYHYYVGAKYFQELGYLYLYDATLVAAHEDHTKLVGVSRYRDQSTYEIVPAGAALTGQDRWRSNFSEDRWRQFKSDVAFFEPRMSLRGWRNALRDKGYNPSPVWTVLGRALAHAVPARPTTAMWLLMHADFLFIVVAVAAVAWAFNLETALLAAALFGVNYATPYPAIGASFLRLDWLMWLVLALCLMKRNVPVLSGATLAYAALLRLSPAVYGAGLAALAVRRHAVDRKVPRWFWRFCLGGVVTTVALVGVTWVTLPEPGHAWQSFAIKMSLHNESLGTKRFGLRYLFVWNGETSREDVPTDWTIYDKQKFERLHRLRQEEFVSKAVLVLLFVFTAARLSPWEAMALGSVLVFVFLSPTRYYYAQLITLVPLLTHRWSGSRILGLVLLFFMMVVAFALHLSNDLLAFLQFVVSAAMLIVFLYIMTALAWKPEPDEHAVDSQATEVATPPSIEEATDPDASPASR